jgi:hypothetical protein
MKKNKIELLINPFCLGDRDLSILSKKCEKYGLTLGVFNLWDIEDEDLDKLPEYISTLIKEWRTCKRPGSVYSNLFINGQRIPINNWPVVFDEIEEQLRPLAKHGKK